MFSFISDSMFSCRCASSPFSVYMFPSLFFIPSLPSLSCAFLYIFPSPSRLSLPLHVSSFLIIPYYPLCVSSVCLPSLSCSPLGSFLPASCQAVCSCLRLSVLLWQCCVLCLVCSVLLPPVSINSSQLCSPCISTSLVTIMCIYCASFPSFIFRSSLNPSSIFIVFVCLFVF